MTGVISAPSGPFSRAQDDHGTNFQRRVFISHVIIRCGRDYIEIYRWRTFLGPSCIPVIGDYLSFFATSEIVAISLFGVVYIWTMRKHLMHQCVETLLIYSWTVHVCFTWVRRLICTWYCNLLNLRHTKEQNSSQLIFSTLLYWLKATFWPATEIHGRIVIPCITIGVK
jgi:hypothetical protein